MSDLYFPLHSLREGHWFKLICGASFQYLPAVRSLTLAYTLAGADCIDVAADPAAVAAAKEALSVAKGLAEASAKRGFGGGRRPWLMVSLNDGEDPHFRKAGFDATACPSACPRPCETVCPAQAIAFSDRAGEFSGVIDQRCYGCGRCLPVCPNQLIETRSHQLLPTEMVPQLEPLGIDAIEIHTQVGRWEEFQRLWSALNPLVKRLKLLAISCPDGEGLIDYQASLYRLISPLPCPLVWQTDGRPMSGDLGIGTTRAAVKLARKVLSANLPGYVQLAGGTNQHTVTKLKAAGLLNPLGSTPNSQRRLAVNERAFVAGIAYGSYARSLLSPILDKLDNLTYYKSDVNPSSSPIQLEDCPDLLWQAVEKAHVLVAQIKTAVLSPAFGKDRDGKS